MTFDVDRAAAPRLGTRSQKLSLTFGLLLLVWACGEPARAAESPVAGTARATLESLTAEDELSITLDTGEVLSLVFVEGNQSSLVAEHPVLGRLEIPLDRITVIVATATVEKEPEPLQAELPDVNDDPTGWGGEVSFGLDGSTGNSDRSSFRVGVKGEREMRQNRAEASAHWARSEEDSSTTEHKARADGRYDWLFEESLWEAFAKGEVEYDEFKDFDVRVTGFSGAGYRFVDDEDERLIGRVGAGASKKIGGADTDVDPELLLGADYKRRLSELQSVTASLEVFPSLGDFGEYRAIAKADWEVLIAQAAAISLRLGLEDRYDSSAVPGDDKNDLDYYGSLVKKF